jgi:hypothetical protein
VLTGSLARNECWFSKIENGLHCEGDAECLLVFDRATVLPDAGKISILTRQIRLELKRADIRCPVSLSPVTMRYFQTMKPHIFAYELRACGDVIWGDASVLSAIPEFRPCDIPKEDALRMLANRLIEFLECAALDLDSEAPVSARLRYRTAKLYLDMGTSYLVFQSAFEPGYRRRAEILEKLGARRPDHPFPSLDRFVEQVQAATAYKLGVDSGFRADVAEIFAAISDAKALWRWELSQLAASPIRMPKQSMAARLRGWAFVARKCGWQSSFRYGARWLTGGYRLSPRYSIYSAAAEILFGLEPGLAAGGKASLARLAQQLPVVRQTQPASWREMATEVGWNYHQFLEATRA